MEDNENIEGQNEEDKDMNVEEAIERLSGETQGDLESERLLIEVADLKDKHMRLYAEFENYKRRTIKDKEEITKYANESIIEELLPAIDHLEIALKHSSDDKNSKGLAEGVEITLRGILKTFDKFGVQPIEAKGLPFNPEVHHAIQQVEREDMDEGTVVEELRKGYVYNGKVIRASLVSVSKKPFQENNEVEISIKKL